jgi:PAS domain S-box-containing protein
MPVSSLKHCSWICLGGLGAAGVLSAAYASVVPLAVALCLLGTLFSVRLRRCRRARVSAELDCARGDAERRAAESRYRELVEQVESIILRLDTEGRLLFQNEYARRFFGYGDEEILGRNTIGPLVPPEESTGRDLAQYMREVCEAPEKHSPGVNENVRKDGSRVWVAWTNKALRDEVGCVRELLCVGTDVTREKFGEDHLLQAKRVAEEASRAKSEFLANMSHEVRTPLNGIIGMTELLCYTPLTDEQREYTDCILSSAEALLGIINDILDLSKIEAGRIGFDMVEFDLKSSLEMVLQVLGVKAEEKGLLLSSELSPGLPLLFRGDSGRLRQVITNLVANGIKFTEEGGVTVRVSLEAEEETRAKLRFDVVDTGIGIPSDRMGCLFQSFSQVDASTTRRYGGTGLGLAISKKLVQLMGGDIGVESEMGKGSRFWFTVWLDKQPICELVPSGDRSSEAS